MNRHIVQKGESLWQIANMHNVSLQTLIEANPQIQDPNSVTIGQAIIIPDDDWKIPEPPTNPPRPENRPPRPENRPPRPENRPPRPDDDNQIVEGEDTDLENAELCRRLTALPRPLIYIVKKGDTLYKISRCFNVGLRELLQVNRHIQNPDLIVPGDKVFIPRSRPDNMPPRPGRPSPNPNTCPYCGRPISRR